MRKLSPRKVKFLSKWQNWVTEPKGVAPVSMFLTSNYATSMLAQDTTCLTQ